MCYCKPGLIGMTLFVLLALSCRERASPVPAQVAGLADTSLVINIYPVGDSGFGYALYQGRRKLIDQPNIPAVQHKIPFRSREEAEVTARLVKQKILAHQFPPTTSIWELDSLQVHY